MIVVISPQMKGEKYKYASNHFIFKIKQAEFAFLFMEIMTQCEKKNPNGANFFFFEMHDPMHSPIIYE